MADQNWKPLDTKRVIERQRKQQEATTSAGVGGFVGPAFGPSVLRPPPVQAPKRKRKSEDPK